MDDTTAAAPKSTANSSGSLKQVNEFRDFANVFAFDANVQPPKTQQKTKEQKMAAAMAGGKGKGKKKWSKGKVREKVANKVLYDQETYERLLVEVPKMKLITASAIVERLKVNAALARASIHELEENGTISKVLAHHAQLIYTRAVAAEE